MNRTKPLHCYDSSVRRSMPGVSDPMIEILSIFHTFDIVNRKTGNTIITLTQIGQRPEDAEYTIRMHNLSGLDFENDYEIVHIL
jgi:hypothetical protein